MLRVRLGLAAGLVATAVALVMVLSRPPLVVAGSNNVAANFAITFTQGNERACQPGGTVPRGTEAIRVSLSPNIGPRVALRLTSGSTVLTEGTRAAGWGVDETVTVPVKRVARTATDTRVCTTIGPTVEGVQVNGETVREPSGRSTYRLRMEYLRPGDGSWLSRASSIASRMGLAHAPTGAWPAYLAIVAMIAVCVIASRLVLRELR
ncbi:MAG TPA: hypothetical protein VFY36_05890 [Solirubrobacteraceae bacterium]|nr:hypothetical protein [Solirubrobacteraceae bacterium]